MSDKKYPGDDAILAFKLCAAVLSNMEAIIPAAKSMLEVAEAVTKKIDEQPRGRRAAIKAQKERNNAQS